MRILTPDKITPEILHEMYEEKRFQFENLPRREKAVALRREYNIKYDFAKNAAKIKGDYAINCFRLLTIKERYKLYIDLESL